MVRAGLSIHTITKIELSCILIYMLVSGAKYREYVPGYLVLVCTWVPGTSMTCIVYLCSVLEN
jgi:hypothetical protein